MSSRYNNNIAEAMDILLNKRLSSLSYDQTIVAEIDSIIDSSTGHYKIRYQSVIFDAYAEDTSKTYKINHSVYVKVPQSDFSQRLLIEGNKDYNAELTALQTKYLKNYKIPISPNFQYNDRFELVAGPEDLGEDTPNPQSVSKQYFISYEEKEAQDFTRLAKDYEVIELKAKFGNCLIDKHTTGNYGLKFKFLTSDNEQENVTQTYILDLKNFSGSLFGYNTTGSEQSVMIMVQKGSLKALESIEFFQEGILQDKDINRPKIDLNGNVIDYPKITTPNLWVSDIQITFYEVVDLLSEDLHLYLSAPQGYYGSELKFTAHLLNKGEDIIGQKAYSTFWYKYSPKIDNTTTNFLGMDWQIINENSNNVIIIKPTNVIDLYMVRVYNATNEVVAEKTFEVSDSENNILPSVIQSSEPGQVTLILPEGIEAEWIVADQPRGRSQNLTLTLENDFKTITLKVEAVIYKDNEMIGTKILYLSAPIEEEDIKVTFSGTLTYQYDSSGDMYLEDARKEKQLVIGVLLGENIQNTITKEEIYLGDFLLTQNKEDWKNWENKNKSLMEDLYFSLNENKALTINYTISPRYDYNKTLNTIKYIITLQGGEQREYECPITFLKVGDLGTNGSSDSFRLSAEKEIFYVNQEEDYIINLEVYKNGKYIENNYDNQYTLSQVSLYQTKEDKSGTLEPIDCKEQVTLNQQLVIQKEQIDTTKINYVVVTIQINGNQITSYYGIPIAENNFAQKADITKYVRYNFDGKNPQYQGSNFTPNPLFNYTQADGRRYYFINYNFNNIDYPIVHFLNTYGNQSINNWDGTVLIDSENNTVLANQIIAGTKTIDEEGNPKFSGVIMGKIQDDSEKEEGIYGYKNNLNTFGLKNDGTAYFGSGAGRITFDGENATIQGGNIDIDGDGKIDYPDSMIIDLNAKKDNNNEIPSAIIINHKIPKEKEIIKTIDLKYNGDLQLQSPEYLSWINKDFQMDGGVSGSNLFELLKQIIELIDQEKQRALGAEQNLQEQIKALQQGS